MTKGQVWFADISNGNSENTVTLLLIGQ